MDRKGNRHRLWVFVGLATVAFAIPLVMIVVCRLDDEALGVLIGIAGGVGAMCDLMSNRQLTWQAAHAICWRHWETTLLPWMWPNRTRNTTTK